VDPFGSMVLVASVGNTVSVLFNKDCKEWDKGVFSLWTACCTFFVAGSVALKRYCNGWDWEVFSPSLWDTSSLSVAIASPNNPLKSFLFFISSGSWSSLSSTRLFCTRANGRSLNSGFWASSSVERVIWLKSIPILSASSTRPSNVFGISLPSSLYSGAFCSMLLLR